MESDNSQKSPSSVEELVEFIDRCVRDLYDKNKRRMDGSLLAYLIRSEYPGIDYTKLGLTRLGDAVRIAENLKLVERHHHDVRHLELSPANKNGDSRSQSMSANEMELVVVKLTCLNGKQANLIYQAYPDPILAPNEHQCGDSLFEWLTGTEAALVKEPPWIEQVRVAAMLAILAKLIRNKSWNSTTAGHAWTQAADLLGQAPVYREDGILYAEARVLLARMENIVLLCKGGKQGKTKKEWCIRLDQLRPVKRAVLSRSVDPLREDETWSSIVEYADQGPGGDVTVDDDIVSETVRYHCREHR